ncbi:MAG: tetratricopeptide repeat protein [Candidatus Peribacteria bacterium]|nr:MAG: tetratricopeptide repeat protein [Candidatus Peribacteria bacterium]
MEIAPEYVDAIVYKAITYIDLEAYEDALSAAEQAIQMNPNHENAWYYKAQALKSLGRTQEAIVAYEKVLEINPSNEYARQDLVSLDPSRDVE